MADILLDEIDQHKTNVSAMTNTTVTGYYIEDEMFTAMRGEDEYFTIKAKRTIVASGAQERMIPFINNDIPGVYGAGAVQTLMNLYGVVPGRRVLMVGAGNIGLIVSYQMMQAGVEVAAIVETGPRIGGCWVHAAKVRRMGVPILLHHTVIEAKGDKTVSGAVISELDDKFQPTGAPMDIDRDVICLAVGLSPTTDLLGQARVEMRYVPQLCGYVALRDRTMRTSDPKFWTAVINCAGAYAQEVEKMAGVEIPNWGERHEIMITEPVEAGVCPPMLMSFSGNYYVQQRPHGSIICGMSPAGHPKDFEKKTTWQFITEMSKVLNHLLPVTKGIRVVRHWSGLYDMTPDGSPIIGETQEVKNFYHSTGFSGHGFMLGPVAGKILAQHLTGKKPDIDFSMLDYKRFERNELLIEPNIT